MICHITNYCKHAHLCKRTSEYKSELCFVCCIVCFEIKSFTIERTVFAFVLFLTRSLLILVDYRIYQRTAYDNSSWWICCNLNGLVFHCIFAVVYIWLISILTEVPVWPSQCKCYIYYVPCYIRYLINRKEQTEFMLSFFHDYIVYAIYYTIVIWFENHSSCY